MKSRLEKSPRLFPLNIVYLFCEVRYGWSPLMRRNIVSASQAPFSLSNSALWRFFNGQMLKGEKIKAFLLRQGRNSRYSTSARAWWNVWGSAWLFISISSNSFMYNTKWVVSSKFVRRDVWFGPRHSSWGFKQSSNRLSNHAWSTQIAVSRSLYLPPFLAAHEGNPTQRHHHIAKKIRLMMKALDPEIGLPSMINLLGLAVGSQLTMSPR